MVVSQQVRVDQDRCGSCAASHSGSWDLQLVSAPSSIPGEQPTRVWRLVPTARFSRRPLPLGQRNCLRILMRDVSAQAANR